MHTVRWCVSKSTHKRVKMLKRHKGQKRGMCPTNATLHTKRRR